MRMDENVDVVVIGSGLAGLAAAIEAAAAGASVAVLEKMKITGGNTRISDGALSAPGNFLQRKAKVEDSPEQFAADMVKAGLGLNHPELVRIVAERAAETIEWTRVDLGVRYLDQLDRFGGHAVARSVTTRSHSGVDIIKAQAARLTELGVSVRTRCLFKGFLTAANGEVRGVRFQEGYRFSDADSGVPRTIGARRAVVLATGGFANDPVFRAVQHPGLDASLQTTNHRGATAEGLIAALGLKACPVHLSWIQLGPWGCTDEKGYGKGGAFCILCRVSGRDPGGSGYRTAHRQRVGRSPRTRRGHDESRASLCRHRRRGRGCQGCPKPALLPQKRQGPGFR